MQSWFIVGDSTVILCSVLCGYGLHTFYFRFVTNDTPYKWTTSGKKVVRETNVFDKICMFSLDRHCEC